MQWETERLQIVELSPGMARALHQLSLDAANRRFLPDEVFETEADAARAIEGLRAQYGRTDGPLVYAVALKGGPLIGHVEAAPIPEGWEIGYHIGQEYTGRGYAAEAARAFAPGVMALLNLGALYGVCDAENAASCRVLEKVGFRLIDAGKGLYQRREIPIRRYVLGAE